MKKSYFRDVLDKFERSGLKIWEVLVTKEVSCMSCLSDLDDESYDVICNYIYEWTMKNEYVMPNDLAIIVDGILRDKEFTIKDFEDDSDELEAYIEEELESRF